MADLIPRRNRRMPDRPSRELARGVEDAHADAAEGTARVEGGAFVAQVSLMHAGNLTMVEQRLFRHAPTGEHRYTQIAEAFSAGAAMQVFGVMAPSRFR